MIIFNYCKDGESVSDFGVEEHLDKIFNDFGIYKHTKSTMVIDYSSAIIFYALRLRVKEEKINKDGIAFMFNKEIIYIDSQGNLSDEPIGFCDIETNYLLSLV